MNSGRQPHVGDAGRRCSTPPASPTIIGYIHELNDRIIAETDASGTTLREYVWMDYLPVAAVDNVNRRRPWTRDFPGNGSDCIVLLYGQSRSHPPKLHRYPPSGL
ncbi:hypothetical protein [Terripilifer ovatus]|uniref:hypothetical protein n=1 Tax=Terripilifer ovatus TaxID=3032367 RepID=UPI003AB92B54